ncbi:MAG: hypothetical protein V9G09_02775 [Candidatus Nanopelagicales bacterium]
MAVAGTALLFLLARWGIALAAVAVGVLWSVWLIGAAPPDARWFFGVAGVGLFAFSLRKGAAPLAWFAALFVQTAFLLQIDRSAVLRSTDPRPGGAFAAGGARSSSVPANGAL